MKARLRRKFPPDPPVTLEHAHVEVVRAAKWASDMGFENVWERLVWAAGVIREEIETNAPPTGQR